MAKRNLLLPPQFDALLELGGDRSTYTKVLCAALYWFFEELEPGEREKAYDQLKHYQGPVPNKPQGCFRPGLKLTLARNQIAMLLTEHLPELVRDEEVQDRIGMQLAYAILTMHSGMAGQDADLRDPMRTKVLAAWLSRAIDGSIGAGKESKPSRRRKSGGTG